MSLFCFHCSWVIVCILLLICCFQLVTIIIWNSLSWGECLYHIVNLSSLLVAAVATGCNSLIVRYSNGRPVKVSSLAWVRPHLKMSEVPWTLIMTQWIHYDVMQWLVRWIWPVKVKAWNNIIANMLLRKFTVKYRHSFDISLERTWIRDINV